MELDLKELFWRLLKQYKAILIFSLIMAVLLCLAQHFMAVKAYNAAMEADKEKAEQVELSLDEQIDKVLKKIPESERAGVEYLVHGQEWINAQKKYLDESLLMGTDPTNQRVLVLTYAIEGAEEKDLPSLISNYKNYLISNKNVEVVKPLISEEAEDKYIAELIQFADEDKVGFEIDTMSGSNTINALIVLPYDTTDGEKVADAVTASVKDYSKSQQHIQHTVRLSYSEEETCYDKFTGGRMREIMVNINSMDKALVEAKKSMSDEQKAAAEAIVAIKDNARNLEEADPAETAQEAADDEPEVKAKPGFSKKYALAGFVLGAMLYALAFTALMMLRDRVNSAVDTVNYTGARLLGEVYHPGDHKGIQKLMNSEAVGRIQHKGKSDTEAQIRKAVSALEALCEHKDVRDLTVLDLTASDGAAHTVNEIAQSAENRDLRITVLGNAAEIEEKSLNAMDNAVIAVSDRTKASDVFRMMEMLGAYDVKGIGSVYTAAL